MFESFMIDTWIASTAVAVVAGVVGFFVVIRGTAFLAHAVPHGAFAGAAGAVLVGADPLIGLAVFSAAGALGVSALARRARTDVITALVLVAMLGLGAFFLSRSNEYSAEVFGLLFGQVLGVSEDQVVTTLLIGLACLVVVGALWRPLLLASVLPDTAPARGVNPQLLTVVFALVLAAATTMSVPIVGALLMFALLVGPPATARIVVRTPEAAAATSVLIAIATVWASIALAYETDWPVGFFVATISAAAFIAARAASALDRQINLDQTGADMPRAASPDQPIVR